jgi:ATP synthase protein I
MLQRHAGLTSWWLTPNIAPLFKAVGASSRSEHRGHMFKMVFLQFGATLVATAISAVFFGVHGALSAGLAGLACVVPNALFALRLTIVSRRSGAPPVTAFFVGELIKLAAIVGLLVLVQALYDDLHWGAMLIGLILTLKANLFAFLVKK